VARTTSSHGRNGEPAYASVMRDGDDTTELPGKKKPYKAPTLHVGEANARGWGRGWMIARDVDPPTKGSGGVGGRPPASACRDLR